MKNEQWKAIQAVFEQMDRFCRHLEKPMDVRDSSLPAENSVQGAPGEIADPTGGECYDLVEVRTEIRTQLDFLRVKLAEQFAERDCYLVLFPIVAHFDEHVKTCYLDENQMRWPPLQKELFHIDDAGEIFYETVDDILRKPQTIPFIYEIYYFCLSRGFRGRYVDNPIKINEYMKKLQEKIPVTDLPEVQSTPEESEPIQSVGSFAWYYIAVALFLVGFFFLLRAFAGQWDLRVVPPEAGVSSHVRHEKSNTYHASELPSLQSPPQQDGAENRTGVNRAPPPGGEPLAGRLLQRSQDPFERVENAHQSSEDFLAEVENAPQRSEDLLAEVENAPQRSTQPAIGGTREKENVPNPLPASTFVYCVQVGAFRNPENARTRLQELQGRYGDVWRVWQGPDAQGGWYKVLIGTYNSRNTALDRLEKLKALDEFHDAIQVRVPTEAPFEPPKNNPLARVDPSNHDRSP